MTHQPTEPASNEVRVGTGGQFLAINEIKASQNSLPFASFANIDTSMFSVAKNIKAVSHH